MQLDSLQLGRAIGTSDQAMCKSPETSFLRHERRAEKRQLKQHYKDEKRELKTLKRSLRRSVRKRPCSHRADTIVLADRTFDPLQTAKAIDVAICALKEKYANDLTLMNSKYRSARETLARTETKVKSSDYDVIKISGCCCCCCYKEMIVRRVLPAHHPSDAGQPRFTVTSTTATTRSKIPSTDGNPRTVRISLSSDSASSHCSTSTELSTQAAQKSIREPLLSQDERSKFRQTTRITPPPSYADKTEHPFS